MKKYLFFSVFVIAAILIISFKHLDEKEKPSSKSSVSLETKVDEVLLNALFIDGNMIDETLPYGNQLTKKIKITNKDNKDGSFAISLSETSLNQSLLYDVLYSYDDATYNLLSEKNTLTSDDFLAYNLLIEKSSNIFIKIVFLANNENMPTQFKGKIDITTNLSDKDIFAKDVLTIQSKIENKITELNGINESGFYIVNIEDIINDTLKDYKGYVMIDASNYADLKYYYYLYDSYFMLNKYKLVDTSLKKNIESLESDKISSFTTDNICRAFTKKECTNFSDIQYNPLGGKNNFYKNSLAVIDLVKADFTNKENKVYIYDVLNDINNKTDIRGYILVDNRESTSEYYLYLTNELYMVSGYNYTKLGSFTTSSNTIRAYSATSFNLSSENKAKVCTFSGFNECFSKNGEKVY